MSVPSLPSCGKLELASVHESLGETRFLSVFTIKATGQATASFALGRHLCGCHIALTKTSIEILGGQRRVLLTSDLEIPCLGQAQSGR